ncbi:MAG TPA: hypothetical protein VM536_20180 [Chloroflexia bacterium]|nr:hypothetical protein [Chloroflexia bacterium]
MEDDSPLESANPPVDSTSPVVAAWYERVTGPDELVACVEDLGLLPLRAPAGWPTLPRVLAPEISMTTAWSWVGELVSSRRIFAGHVLPGLGTACLTSLPVFSLAFARGPSSDPAQAYAAGLFGITGKAVVDLLQVRGPLTLQQIRLGLGQHKRFLIHDTPRVMDELERALVVIAGATGLTAGWRSPQRGPSKPRSRFNPAPSPNMDLRVWELTLRWAPPAALAAADRLREQPGAARALLRDRLAALNPVALPAELDTLLGEDPGHEPHPA